MTNTIKKTIQILAAILALLIIAYVALHFSIKNAIETALKEKAGDSFQIQYDDVSLNLFLGAIHIRSLQVKAKGESIMKTPLKMNRLEIEGLDYLSYVQSGNFKMNTVLFDAVEGVLVKKDSLNSSKPEVTDFNKKITIKKIILKNSNFTQLDAENDSILIALKNLNVTFENFSLDKASLASKIPFEYTSYQINSGAIYADVSPFEKFKIDSVYTDEKLVVKGFQLVSKYDKVRLQSKVTKERDFIDLTIPSIEIEGIQYKKYKDSSLLRVKAIEISKLNLEMYRNKLLPDDFEVKELLYQKIANLPIKIDIQKVSIKNGAIAYTELANENVAAGKIYFTGLNSTIENISNLNTDPITFKNKANLMGVSPVTLDWSFRENSNENLFLLEGTVMDFNTKDINSFMMSNLRAKSSGTIQELYFTVSGNDYASSGDMKMKYDDFKFQVLKKDRSGVNEVLTFIGTIFTNDGSNTNERGYRFGSIETERDNTKSFFNYVWKNVSSGLVSTLTGNGEKEE